MNRTFVALGILILVGIGIAVYALTQNPKMSQAEPTTFAECAERYPVMESYPRQCNTPSGLHFTEELGEVPVAPEPTTASIPDLITVQMPVVNQNIETPLQVAGSARGTWYFEASFPIEVKNAAGVVIGTGYAEALEDWMTEEFVPFSGTVTFAPQPSGSTGTVVLHKSNASGDPIRDQSLVIPVQF